ncbi:MAG TPA: hypothetical protein VF041_22300 [Gemmatimonadaceae bacterium]
MTPVYRRSTRILVFALCVLVGACVQDRHAPRDTARGSGATSASAPSAAVGGLAGAAALPSAPRADWVTYRGEGFTLRYPPNAILRPGRSHPSDIPGIAIQGPRIHVPVPPDQGPSDGPAYELQVASFPNPAGVSAEAWVDSIRGARNAHEMDPDSLDYLGPADTVTFGSVRALRLQPYCGDCESVELYLASPRRRIIASYIGDISFPGDRDAQRRLYAAILSTFQWTP